MLFATSILVQDALVVDVWLVGVGAQCQGLVNGIGLALHLSGRATRFDDGKYSFPGTVAVGQRVVLLLGVRDLQTRPGDSFGRTGARRGLGRTDGWRGLGGPAGCRAGLLARAEPERDDEIFIDSEYGSSLLRARIGRRLAAARTGAHELVQQLLADGLAGDTGTTRIAPALHGTH